MIIEPSPAKRRCRLFTLKSTANAREATAAVTNSLTINHPPERVEFTEGTLTKISIPSINPKAIIRDESTACRVFSAPAIRSP